MGSNSLSVFDRIPVEQLIEEWGNESDTNSDTCSVKSETECTYLSEEEYQNKYSFLDSFKKPQGKRIKKPRKESPLLKKEDTPLLSPCKTNSPMLYQGQYCTREQPKKPVL